MPLNTSYLIFPGIHKRELTEDLIKIFKTESLLVYEEQPAFCTLNQLIFVKEHQASLSNNLLIIAFSAGVVGAIGTAKVLQEWGYTIKGLIAIDGWGVPLIGNFPIYRLSCDYYTHWTSHLLGGGTSSFYADPPVKHLQMWQTSEQVTGWLLGEKGKGCFVRSRVTLVEALKYLVKVSAQ